MFNKIVKFTIGLVIIFLIYYFSVFLVKIAKISFPPAVLGIIIFTFLLSIGIIKEEWIKQTCDVFLSNMSLLFVPFVVGLVAYKEILLKNWICVLITLTLSTALTIIIVGLTCEYGIKLQRLNRLKRNKK